MIITELRYLGRVVFKGISEARKARKPETLALKRLQAKAYVAGISDETWNKISKSIFAQPNEPKSKLLDKLHQIKSTYDEIGVTLPEDVADALKTLEHKATVFVDRMGVAVAKGKEQKNSLTYGKKFAKSNRRAISKIDNYAVRSRDKATEKCRSAIEDCDFARAEKAQVASAKLLSIPSISHIESSDLYSDKIQEVAKDEFKSEQMLYHGTKHAKKILAEGFSLMPKNGQAATACRELGQGVYLTPSRRCASHYAGANGSILHLKINEGKIAAVNSDQLTNIFDKISTEMGLDALEPVKLELIIKTLFQRNGYSAAYTRGALAPGFWSGFRKLVDSISGGKQSQVCVFEPSDIKILGKSISERVENQKMQIASAVQLPYNTVKGIIAMIHSFLN